MAGQSQAIQDTAEHGKAKQSRASKAEHSRAEQSK
jgi:hypothetical protein